MNKPQAIEYTTSHGHTVVLADPKNLVVKQGFKCIDGGTAKHGGKNVRLMVRYDNKPELAAEIKSWKAAWDKYDEFLSEQVELARSTMKCNTRINFDKAENSHFSWTYWDGTSGKTLTEKGTGREIYQMRYTDNGKSVEGDDKIRAMAFWRALEQLKDKPAPTYTSEELKAIEEQERQEIDRRNSHPGWCNHCHSYCYGDCQS
jgi:hypothetical protein